MTILLLEIFGPKVPNSWKYFPSLYIIETATVQAKSALDLVTISYQLLWYFPKGRDSPFVRIVSSSCFPQLVKNSPAVQESWVWSLGWEDPLQKGKATHSSILTFTFCPHHGALRSWIWFQNSTWIAYCFHFPVVSSFLLSSPISS